MKFIYLVVAIFTCDIEAGGASSSSSASKAREAVNHFSTHHHFAISRQSVGRKDWNLPRQNSTDINEEMQHGWISYWKHNLPMNPIVRLFVAWLGSDSGLQSLE